MISERKIARVLVLFAVALVATTALAQGDPYQLRYEEERARNRLLDREKWLLKENDDLERDIYQLKLAVEVRLRKLSSAQKRLDQVRHDLITVRMKLMP